MDYRSSIAFIGGGNMAEALAGGIVRAGIVPAESITVSDPGPERCEYLKDTYGFNVMEERFSLLLNPRCFPGSWRKSPEVFDQNSW